MAVFLTDTLAILVECCVGFQVRRCARNPTCWEKAGVEMPAALVSFVQVTDCSVTMYHSLQNDYLPFFLEGSIC